MDPPEIERRFEEALALYPPLVRAEMLRVLTLPDDGRARRIGELYADERSRGFAEVLIDVEEEPAARAVLVGMLRESERP
jgi:hypothetical protein